MASALLESINEQYAILMIMQLLVMDPCNVDWESFISKVLQVKLSVSFNFI